MFLFAGDQMETVLYTGDFRFELDYYDNADQAMSKCVHEIMLYLRNTRIDRLYLVCTICV